MRALLRRDDLVTSVHRYLHSPATSDLTKFFSVVRFAEGEIGG
jgi:hypothetical protein